MKKTHPRSGFTPDGWHTVTPRLIASDAKGLVDFLKAVFGATGAYHRDRPTELKIGDSIIMVSDSRVRDPAPAFLYVYVKDADETYRKAISRGAESVEEPSDLPYGDRRATVKDQWGNTWQIATRQTA